jgi:excisionase family DNA binding protein
MQTSLLRQREVARFLNRSCATVKRLRDRKELPFVWVGGAVRFERAAIENFLNRQRKESADAK